MEPPLRRDDRGPWTVYETFTGAEVPVAAGTSESAATMKQTKPVVDDTELKDGFDIALKWEQALGFQRNLFRFPPAATLSL